MDIPHLSDILKSIQKEQEELETGLEKSSSLVAEYFQEIVEPRIAHILSKEIRFENFKTLGKYYFCRIELTPSVFSPKHISSPDVYLKYQDINKHFKASRYFFPKYSFQLLHSFKKGDPQYGLFSNILQQLADKGYKTVLIKTDGFSSIENIRVCLFIDIPIPNSKENLS